MDTPEIRGKCEEEKRLALEARDYVRAVVGETVQLVDVRQGKYAGRVVAAVRLADGVDLGLLLIESGHGCPYDDGARFPWCDGGCADVVSED